MNDFLQHVPVIGFRELIMVNAGTGHLVYWSLIDGMGIQVAYPAALAVMVAATAVFAVRRWAKKGGSDDN